MTPTRSSILSSFSLPARSPPASRRSGRPTCSRLAADCRSAIADVLALLFCRGAARPLSEPPRLADAMVFALLFSGGLGVILFFRDRGWHVAGALVAALAFSFGGRPLRASSTSARSKAWCSCRSRCGCWRARSNATLWAGRRGRGRVCRLSSCSAATRRRCSRSMC